MGQSPEPMERLVEIAMAIDHRLAEGGVKVEPELIVEALIAGGIPSLLVPHETPAVADEEALPAPHRYSVRANPAVADGAMSTISFRVPSSVRKIFDERVAELKEADDPAIQNQTDAGQDAIVKWCLMEGK